MPVNARFRVCVESLMEFAAIVGGALVVALVVGRFL